MAGREVQKSIQIGQPSLHTSFGFEGWFWRLVAHGKPIYDGATLLHCRLAF